MRRNTTMLTHGVRIALVLLITMLYNGTALAQGATASNAGGPPPLIFIGGLVAVLVTVVAIFLIFAKSQGCDTNKEKKKQWQ